MNALRSWSQFEVKSVEDDARIIRGIASTPNTDRVGDIVVPTGAKFQLPLAMLSQHDHQSPIGNVVEAKVKRTGIEIVSQIAKDTGLDYIERAWLQIKAGLVRGLSIGFRPLKAEPIDEDKPWGGYKFLEWEWYELSAVTIPANADATITSIKMFDTARSLRGDDPAASGLDRDPAKVIHQAKAAILRANMNLRNTK